MLALMFCAITCSTIASPAQARPLAQKRVATVLPWLLPVHRLARGRSVVSGTIAGQRGTRIVIRLRNGRLVAIDGAAAMSSGNFSAPLFVGKFVMIDGTVHGATFTAAHIIGLTSLAHIPSDR
jgi:hypothetical protein